MSIKVVTNPAPELLPIARPWIGNEEQEAVARALQSGWVSQGPEVAAFEQEFADFVGAQHACAVSSCTTALHLALLAAGVEPGDEVITASHSFIATANAIRYCGALPVFVDIDALTWNLDPSHLDSVYSTRSRAVLVVHQLGMPCDLAAILSWARQRGLLVIEDAACAIGSQIEHEGVWETIGRPHGDIACFSFHPRKVMTTGDGGMLTTNNADYDAQFRLWRQHGMSVPDTVRHGAREVVFESYAVLGFNYRMTDIQAAMGRAQLQRMPAIIERRRALAAHYQTLLASLSGVSPPIEPVWARSNWQSYAIRLEPWIDQRRLMQDLLDLGVATRRGVMCIHREAAYATGTWSCGADADCGCAPQSCARLLASEQAQDFCVVLPLFPQMSFADQLRVAEGLKQAIAKQEADHGH